MIIQQKRNEEAEKFAALEQQIVKLKTENDKLKTEIDDLKSRLDEQRNFARDQRAITVNNVQNIMYIEFGKEPHPDIQLVKSILYPPCDSVLKLFQMLHSRPETSNIRIANAKSKNCQLMKIIDGELRWVEENCKITISNITEKTLDLLVDKYGATKDRNWNMWYVDGRLNEDGYDKTAAFMELSERIHNHILSRRPSNRVHVS